MAFCIECGTPHGTGQRYCANCGTQLGGVITKTEATSFITGQRAPATGLSITSFILGLLSLIGAPGGLALFFAPWILGGGAIFTGIFAHRRAQEYGLKGDGLASAGIVLGIIATVISAIFLVSLHPWSSGVRVPAVPAGS